jgi:hypothetical protein
MVEAIAAPRSPLPTGCYSLMGGCTGKSLGTARGMGCQNNFHLDSLCPTTPAKVVAIKKGTMNENGTRQMEFGLNAKPHRLARQARRQRRQRAQWWFAQMRRVVESAMDWQPESQGRPAQVYLALAAKRP